MLKFKGTSMGYYNNRKRAKTKYSMQIGREIITEKYKQENNFLKV